MGGRTAVLPAAAIWAGICCGAPLALGGIVACSVLAALALALACRAGPRFGALLLCLACFLAASARGGAYARCWSAASATLPVEGRPQWLRGVVADHPWQESGEPSAILAVQEAERAPALHGTRVRLWLPPGADVEWGDRIEVLASLEPPAPQRVPGGFDPRAAARACAIVGQGRATTVRRLSGARSVARATLVRWRRGIEEILRRNLSPEAREIVSPLVIGDRSAVSAELAAGFQASGLTHLLALSGLHVVWMAGVARGLIALLGSGVRARAVSGALCAAWYLGIAGPLPSLVRAAGAECLAGWAAARDRPLDPAQSLAVVAALTLAVAPGWASDLGFQLSCAATLGLITIGAGARRRIAVRWRTVQAVWHAALPTLSAQVSALPLLLARFHALPWTTLGANLLAVPVCELMLAAAWLAVALETLVPGASAPALGACEALSATLRWVVGHAAAAPIALWPAGHSATVPWVAALGAAALLWSLAGPRTIAEREQPQAARTWAAWLGAEAVLLALLLAAASPPSRPPPDRWWVVALDVGQGDAIALGFSDGWWLIDTGPASARLDAGRSAVLPFFRWAGERSLDTVLLTHAHLDHTGGAPAVLSALPVRRLVLRAGMHPLFSIPRNTRSIPINTLYAVAGDTLRSEFPRVIVRWPPPGMRSRDENAISLALEVGGSGHRALLSADIDSTVEASLGLRSIEVLKVAHHGAATSSGARALEQLRPRVALISCGRHNPFGHPDPGALDRLRQAGASVHRTDREGTIWLEIGPHGVRRIDWRAGFTRETRALAPPAPSAGRTLAGAPARW
jgi:competence protein ComEC